MAELISGLRSETIRANLERIRSEIAAAVADRRGTGPSDGGSGGEGDRPHGGAGGDGDRPHGGAGGEPNPPAGGQRVEVLAATKYVTVEDLPILAEAGIRVVGENRAQDLQAKVAAHGELFAWDFIGQLQSRRVPSIVPHVRLIHSVASDSALRELARYRELARPGMRILVEVNLAREPRKAGVAPEELDSFIARSPVPVAGLMTMPPLSSEPDRSRPWFAALREMARERGLDHLSMGTSQDYVVAAEEGATIVRIGTKLYHRQPWQADCPPSE